MDKIERRKRRDAALAAAGTHDSADKIEKWIRMVAARHIAVGEGKWIDSPESAFGRPIYHLSHGPVTLVFSQWGFSYEGPSPPFECRYEEIESINGPTLRDYMLVRGDAEKMLTSELIMRAVPPRLEMQLQARLGWVVNALLRIGREFN